MNCQICNKNTATFHITEIVRTQAEEGGAEVQQVVQKHVCQACAKVMQIPSMPSFSAKGVASIWKLLESAQKARAAVELVCPDCGMTLSEFRSKGRLGCPKDYQVFARHLAPLLQRMHNATRHVGRIPGLDEGKLLRMQRITQLREALEVAVREEQYEDAARLRDELQQLEDPGKG